MPRGRPPKIPVVIDPARQYDRIFEYSDYTIIWKYNLDITTKSPIESEIIYKKHTDWDARINEINDTERSKIKEKKRKKHAKKNQNSRR